MTLYEMKVDAAGVSASAPPFLLALVPHAYGLRRDR
jgi:hypothetical protein